MNEHKKPQMQSMDDSPRTKQKASSPQSSVKEQARIDQMLAQAFSDFKFEEKEFEKWQEKREQFKQLMQQLQVLKEQIEEEIRKIKLPEDKTGYVSQISPDIIQAKKRELEKISAAIEARYNAIYVKFPQELLRNFEIKQVHDNFEKNFKKDAISAIQKFVQDGMEPFIQYLNKKETDVKTAIDQFNSDYRNVATITLQVVKGKRNYKLSDLKLDYHFSDKTSELELLRRMTLLSMVFPKSFAKHIKDFEAKYKDFLIAEKRSRETKDPFVSYAVTAPDDVSVISIRAMLRIDNDLTNTSVIRSHLIEAQQQLSQLQREKDRLSAVLQKQIEAEYARFVEENRQVASGMVGGAIGKAIAAEEQRTAAEQAKTQRKAEEKVRREEEARSRAQQLAAEEKAKEKEEKTAKEKARVVAEEAARREAEKEAELKAKAREEKEKQEQKELPSQNPKEMLEALFGYDDLRWRPEDQKLAVKISALKANKSSDQEEIKKLEDKQSSIIAANKAKLAKWDEVYAYWFETQGKEFSKYYLQLQRLRVSFDTIKAADNWATKSLGMKIKELETQLSQFYPSSLDLIEHYNAKQMQLTVKGLDHSAINQQIRSISENIYSSMSKPNTAPLASIKERIQAINMTLTELLKTTPAMPVSEKKSSEVKSTTFHQPTVRETKEKQIEEKKKDLESNKIYYDFICHLFLDNEKKFTRKKGLVGSLFAGHEVYTNVMKALGWNAKTKTFTPPKQDFQEIMKDVYDILTAKINAKDEKEEKFSEKFFDKFHQVDPANLKQLKPYYQIYGVAICSIMSFRKAAVDSKAKLDRAYKDTDKIISQIKPVKWDVKPLAKLKTDLEQLEKRYALKS